MKTNNNSNCYDSDSSQPDISDDLEQITALGTKQTISFSELQQIVAGGVLAYLETIEAETKKLVEQELELGQQNHHTER